MSNSVHSTVLLAAEEGYFQSLCLCGWFSQTSFREEADLLRAIHARDVAVFGGGA